MLPSWNPIVADDVRRLDEEFPVPRSQFPDHCLVTSSATFPIVADDVRRLWMKSSQFPEARSQTTAS